MFCFQISDPDLAIGLVIAEGARVRAPVNVNASLFPVEFKFHDIELTRAAGLLDEDEICTLFARVSLRSAKLETTQCYPTL